MLKEEKFFLEKEDDLEKVKEVISSSSGDKIILNIPRGSRLAHLDYLKEIKSYGSKHKKHILIESVDEKILDLAALAGILSYNPIFKKKEILIADIVPLRKGKNLNLSKEENEEEKENEKSKKDDKKSVKKSKKEEKREKEEEEDEVELKEDLEEILEEDFVEEEKEDEEDEEDVSYLKKEKKTKKKIKSLLKAGVTLFIIGVLYFVFINLFTKLSISINLKKSKIDFNNQIVVTAKEISSQKGENIEKSSLIYIPGEIIVEKGNLSMHFDGKGEEKDVTSKAEGILTVYNYHSPSPLTFVANTRFEAPNGKIFRAKEKVVIPGYKKDDKGNIIPGKVDVKVIAEEPGESYNLPPNTNWKVPGLKGTPLYDKVYAENKSYMKGGFSGKQFVVSEGDIKKAKESVANEVKNNLENKILLLNKESFKVLDKATLFEIESEDVRNNEKGGFDVFIAASLKKFVFDEDNFKKELIKEYVPDKNLDWRVLSFDVNYVLSEIDFNKGKMIVNASGTIVFEPAFSEEEFIKRILGKNSKEIKKEISEIKGLETANISFWPFWANKAPYNSSRIKIVVE